MGRKKTIVFLHPDLGIGGAERLVVDAAVSLQEREHKVVVFTSHRDPAHCFEEARDGTLDVRVRGNTVFPPSILGRFAIFCAIARQIHLILSIWMTGELRGLRPTDFFVDQLSAGLPLLRRVINGFEVPAEGSEGKTLAPTPARPSIFFYCHFPDLLLTRGRESLVKRLYRIPFDTLEEWSMGFADGIAVNSEFTKGIVTRTWPRLAGREKKQLDVVYPCVDTNVGDGDDDDDDDDDDGTNKRGHVDEEVSLWENKTVFLSINRFERKKDVGLAIKAFGKLLGAGKDAKAATAAAIEKSRLRLVIAGGHDSRVAENVEYHHELETLATSLGLSHATAKTLPTALRIPDEIQVIFLPSVPNKVKDALLSSAALLLYTPQNEHFGIVPLEAMLKRVPVLATDSGGPRETISGEGEVGWRREADEGEWAKVLQTVVESRSTEEGRTALREMGKRGKERVKKRFGRETMGERFDGVFEELGGDVRNEGMGAGLVLSILGLLGLGLASLAALLRMKVMSSTSGISGCPTTSDQDAMAQILMGGGGGDDEKRGAYCRY
ncbi:Alpha-1,3/1,6-mannosyltransferase alg-2 [Zalerion maritima]|uniref:Alpha-1,3/1,6-mannosyltransferase ALG2 n=1 Tax=Zalerion maritima TaxID=339359 RepID=A0AAD5RNP2_9PEZI|nr:Alpha-1,3/1,6-mannosyltransferase alg-2 [Zalerion maritima]